MPSILELHTSPETIDKWIDYGTLDSEVTYYLYYTLKNLMENLPVHFEDMRTLFDIYKKYWLPFGEVLTEIERNGIRVNRGQLENSKVSAEKTVKELKEKVRECVLKLQPDCIEFNPSSVQQMQQLLFAPFTRKRSNKKKEQKGEIKKEKEYDPLAQERNFTVIDEYPATRYFKVKKLDNYDYKEKDSKKAKLKYRDMSITGYGIPVQNMSISGIPSVDSGCLKILAGGVAKDFFIKKNDPETGKIIDTLLNTILKLKSTETLLNTFIVSLMDQIDKKDGRIHSSLNINTETGRLSSRKPNLQNQPALEKDVYKTRLAFEAGEKRKLLIADYGQLELRILAHVTNCKSMIEAFQTGGDFHSRTAAGMFPYIKNELDQNLLRLEKGEGNDNVPLLKDKYANERKKAKTMNFSVAYGKTSFGFAKDWNCSLEEAENFLNLWYSERKEVKDWQEKTKQTAIKYGYTKTLMGRYRILTKHFVEKNKMKILHGLRASINTPIQGGAADVVIAAMVKIYKEKWFKEKGWKIIHQIHDEVILEGPEETADEALELLETLMENPLDNKLRVKLEVDGKVCDNWFESK